MLNSNNFIRVVNVQLMNIYDPLDYNVSINHTRQPRGVPRTELYSYIVSYSIIQRIHHFI